MRALVILVWCCVVSFPIVIFARTTQVDCIELVTADADVVLRGTIVGIDPQPAHLHQRFRITINVAETLWGPEADHVCVAMQRVAPEFDDCLKNKTELLFGLRFGAGGSRSGPLILRAGQSVIELDGKGRGVLTMDFKRLTGRAGILKAARKGVADRPEEGIQKRLLFSQPTGTGLALNPNGEWQNVKVLMPVDKRLKERGERWAKSESVEFRCLAPLALSCFRSDQAIAILKELMHDELHRDFTNARGVGTRYYPARWPAYVVLREWGVAVDKPVTEESLPLRRAQLASGEEAVFVGMMYTRFAGGAKPSGASSSRRFTRISTIPTAPPSPAAR